MVAWKADFRNRAGHVTLPSLDGRAAVISALRGDEQQRVPVEPAGIVGVPHFPVSQERLREDHQLIVRDRSEELACFPAYPLDQPGHPGVGCVRSALVWVFGGCALLIWGFGVWLTVGRV